MCVALYSCVCVIIASSWLCPSGLFSYRLSAHPAPHTDIRDRLLPLLCSSAGSPWPRGPVPQSSSPERRPWAGVYSGWGPGSGRAAGAGLPVLTALGEEGRVHRTKGWGGLLRAAAPPGCARALGDCLPTQSARVHLGPARTLGTTGPPSSVLQPRPPLASLRTRA